MKFEPVCKKEDCPYYDELSHPDRMGHKRIPCGRIGGPKDGCPGPDSKDCPLQEMPDLKTMLAFVLWNTQTAGGPLSTFKEHLAEQHWGDCTQSAGPCLRCFAETMMDEADYLLKKLDATGDDYNGYPSEMLESRDKKIATLKDMLTTIVSTWNTTSDIDKIREPIVKARAYLTKELEKK